MNWIGTAYLVMGALAFVAAMAHLAQAALIRSDPAPLALAMSCLGFSFYNLGSAVVRGDVDVASPVAALALTGTGFVLTSGFVPMAGWTLLDLPVTRGRMLFVVVLVAVSALRLVDMVIHNSVDPEKTVSSVPAALAAVSIGAVWTGESFRSIRRKTPYARSMTLFGAIGFAASLQGLLAVTGVIGGRELFGFAALPFIGFVNTLSTLRYVYALRNASQPAGDFDRYQVLKQLGSGGMGDVFLARRRGPAGFLRDVVLKTLRGTAGGAEARERFLAEARLAAKLRHPNIVDVYDLGERPGGFFIVMEHIEGPGLDHVLAQCAESGTKVPPAVAAEIGVQLCRALGFAHAAGVVHRDLKPQNVMLTFTGVAKLIDFGIAQERGGPEEEGVAGTYGYIAPEQLVGGRAVPAGDLFALGVMLYRVLTLTQPFPQARAIDMLEAVRAGSAPPLASLRPDCPPGLMSAVERCLRFEPNERPRSAAALEAELEAVLAGQRVDLALFVAGLFPERALPAPRERAPSIASDATTATVRARPQGTG